MSLAAGFVTAPAEEPAGQRAKPIIFSEPKSDTVSSNLNQLDLKASPFKSLESNLKKPFEIFDWGQSAGGIRPPAVPIAPPTAPANNRKMKDLLEKREESLMFGPDSGDSDRAEDDPFKSVEDSLKAAGSKLKTPLDRYYDRLDRERSAITNQVRKPDPLSEKPDPGGKDWLGRSVPENPFGDELKASVNSLGRLATNASARGGFISDQIKPKTFEDLIDRQPGDLTERSSSVKETRLDEFRNLLDRPAYAPASNYYSPGLPAAGAAMRPATASPWSTWSATSPPPKSRESFTTRAGLVGAPAQLQSLPSIAATTPSLNPAPPPMVPPKLPASSFSIPKRQF